MPVFLSHKREDSQATAFIAHALTLRGIRFYLDVFDPMLRTTEDITKSLQESIHKCTHIMAVVSEYTTASWWVPFEIGVATELNRRVSTYELSTVNLPDYLMKWPILRNGKDLDKFCDVYELDQAVEFQSQLPSAATRSGADRFHKALLGHLEARPQ